MKKFVRWGLYGVCILWCGSVAHAQEPDPASTPADAPAAAAPAAPDAAEPLRLRPDPDLNAPYIIQPGPADPSSEAAASTDLETGILLVQEKSYAEAVPLLERALKAEPTIEAAWEALGWSYYFTGREEDANRLWKQYLSLRPDSPKAYSLLAQLSILRGDWRATDEYLQGSLRLDPKNYDIRFWYAQNLFRLGRLDASLKILEELFHEDDQRLDVQIELARIYALVQRYEESCDLWTGIIDQIPDNLQFRSEYAHALMLVGSLEEADEQCRMILDEDPRRWEIMNMRADIAEMSLQPERMIETLEELIDDAEDEEVRARLRMRLGTRYVELNTRSPERWPLTLALDEYENALDAMPDNVPWLNLYAQVALKTQNAPLVRRLTSRILDDLNPNNYQAMRSRFELEMLERNYDAAERLLEDMHDVFQPTNPYRYLDLARLEVQRGRYMAAMDALDALEEDGNRGAVLTLLYHGLTESDWMALTSTRRLREHLMALQREGFTFITPADIPEYLEKNARVIERPDPKPWMARQVDRVRYAFTGQPKSVRKLDEIRPVKIAAVTFDDGLRNSFSLGTPVAQELGLTFGMFVITGMEKINAPMYASWEEVRDYRATGAWQIGSHLLDSNADMPLTSDTNVVGRVLPNRIWLKERNRLETLREWSMRIRREFAESRKLLEQRLGLPPGEPLMVAYPYSDIGQDEISNVARITNPIRSILTEADREYQAGFIVDPLGYTMPVDNKLLIRRYEPIWNAESTEVVEHVLEYHPVFLARRLRCEIATLMGKPHLAEKQVELLRRDGYPDRLLRDLIRYTQTRSPSGRAMQADQADRQGTSQNRLRPSNLYLGASFRQNQSNEEIEQNIFEVRGGMNLSERVGLELFLRSGTIDQTVTSNIWFKVNRSERTSSRETRTETVDGVTTISELDVETVSVREVQTNRVQKTK
ncbi:MAG: tetratricopeptide repeat protein [Kiritimatiellae bacterium]|nr:tetratricopeptide repeat protein [Kiritimatiellia bacterium]